MNAPSTPVTEQKTPDAVELGGRSFAEYATSVLRDRLVVLDIAPGTPINDELIGRELGIGRTPVREALKRLEAEHLVLVYPRRGTFAAPVDFADLASITEMRAQLEPLAASRAARFATPSMREDLKKLAETLTQINSTTISAIELMRYDLKVHRSIYAANGNTHLEEDLIKYDNLATRIWCLVINRLPDVGSHVGEHIGLINAIVDGDVERAASLARDHITGFDDLIRSVI